MSWRKWYLLLNRIFLTESDAGVFKRSEDGSWNAVVPNGFGTVVEEILCEVVALFDGYRGQLRSSDDDVSNRKDVLGSCSVVGVNDDLLVAQLDPNAIQIKSGEVRSAASGD